MRAGAIINLDEVKRAHQMVVAKTGLAIQRTAEVAGKAAVQHVNDKPAFKPQTGNLQKKTDYQVAVRRGGKVLTIRNKAKYAATIDMGAKPHVIRPRRRKHLRFIAGGAVVFAKKVNHPGNRPYRFLRAAAGVAGSVWFHDIESELDSIARKF